MSNGEVPEIPDEVLVQIASSPRRISVDGVDYQGQSLSEIIALRKHMDSSKAVCAGFGQGGLIRQVASPPNALGTHCGRISRCCPGGRIW